MYVCVCLFMWCACLFVYVVCVCLFVYVVCVCVCVCVLDDESSLEQGEISSSGTSSPAKGAGSADMDISSAGEQKDGE